MIKRLVIASIGMLLAQPAAAGIFDYNVYAAGNAYISGGSYGKIASGSFADANGSAATNYTSWSGATVADSNAALTYSANLASLTATGTLSSGQWTPGDATLTGTGSGINVYYIDGATWSQLYALTFAGSGTGAIVNVSGTSLSNFVQLNFGGLSADQVVFNFTDATSVTMGGMNVRGTILAPNAAVTIQGGSVAGSVIASSFHSEGATIGGVGFTGFASSAVPEPATWAMMILGFGAIGATLRRRRAVFSALATA